MTKKEKLEGIFTSVYQENLWGDDSSVSGPGSSMEQTSVIRERIIELIKKHNIKTIVDAPCGDFFWMKALLKQGINNINLYTGVDIVEGLVQSNQEKYGSGKICFIKSDLTSDTVPKADLIICRDCFLHLSYRNIYKILNNFKNSGSDYLLVSSYTGHKNKNVYNFYVVGRAINLGKFPFKITDILDIINEEYHGQNEEFNDKSLMLISIGSINLYRIYMRILVNEMFFTSGYLISRTFRKMYRKSIQLIRRTGL